MSGGSMVGSSAPKDEERRLNSWKEIAVFFGRDERTVKRWERQRGLPVRRVPGGQRNRVFAYSGELRRWLDGESAVQATRDEAAPAAQEAVATAPVAPVPVVPSERPRPAEGVAAATVGPPRRFPTALDGLVLMLVVALMAAGVLVWTRPSGSHVPPQAAQDLYLSGVYLWEKRTPDSLREAVVRFKQAIAIDPAYGRAYSGLANTYNLLRQYSAMSPAEAYPLAEAASRRAVELDPDDADAQSALAFVEFYWLRNVGEGFKRFERAVELDPSSSKNRHWQANALLHLGRFPEALDAIATAQRLDPASRSIRASKGLILFCAGQVSQARALLSEIASDEPDFQSPHAYLAFIDLAEADYPAFLTETRIVADMMGDADRQAVASAGRQGFEAGGLQGMVDAMLAVERRLLASGRGFAYNLARLEAISGQRSEAIADLRLSLERREQYIMSLNVDPAFRPLRGDPIYKQLVADVGLPEM